jgi:hypothetical protein
MALDVDIDVPEIVKYDPEQMDKTFVSLDADMRRDFLRGCAWDNVWNIAVLSGVIAFVNNSVPLATSIWDSFARVCASLLFAVLVVKVLARLIPLTRLRPCYTLKLEETSYLVQEPFRKSFSLTDVPELISVIALSAGYALSFHNGGNYAWYGLSVVVAFALGNIWNLCSYDLFPGYTDAAVYLLKDEEVGEEE